MTEKTYHCSCHCGAVAFTAKIDLAKGTTRCNCSICSKARSWFTVVTADKVEIDKGHRRLAGYSWAPPGREANLHYRFCKACGIRVFAQGEDEKLGGKFYAIAVASIDNFEKEVDVLEKSLRYVDGRHDAYDSEPEETRLM